MILFHKLDANYSSLAIFKSLISTVKFSLSAWLHVQVWGWDGAFDPELWGLAHLGDVKGKSGVTEETLILLYPLTSMERTTGKLPHLLTGSTENRSPAEVSSVWSYMSQAGSDRPLQKCYPANYQRDHPSSLG